MLHTALTNKNMCQLAQFYKFPHWYWNLPLHLIIIPHNHLLLDFKTQVILQKFQLFFPYLISFLIVNTAFSSLYGCNKFIVHLFPLLFFGCYQNDNLLTVDNKVVLLRGNPYEILFWPLIEEILQLFE